jgi:hypothetical protein
MQHLSGKGLGLALVACLLTGCPVNHYRGETILNEDGSVRRAVYQPGEPPAGEKLTKQGWDKVAWAPPPEQAEGVPFDHLPRADPPEGNAAKYFVAWGTFKTVKELPETVRFPAPKGSSVADGTLVRESGQTDYVFVVEHRWRETLTDVVTVEGMRKARDELADLAIGLGADVFDEALGKEYDASGLAKWAKSEGKEWLADLTDFAFEYFATHKGPDTVLEFDRGFRKICGLRGLKLPTDDKPLEGEDAKKSLDEIQRDFVIDLVVKHVRKRSDGTAVSKETVLGWLEELNKPRGENDPPNRFQVPAEKVITTKFKTPDAFWEKVAALGVRIGGLYRIPYFGNSGRFDYVLKVPGEVVETDGQILGGDRVRWRFDAEAAYPQGYPMTCRSLAPQLSLQKDLLKGQPLTGREAMLDYVALLTKHPFLLSAMEECRKQKKMAPLYRCRQLGKAEAQEVDRLLKLLGLPEEEP